MHARQQRGSARRTGHRALALGLLLLLGLPTLLPAQTRRASVAGRIVERESEEAVVDVEVRIVELGREAVTNGRGFFRFVDVPPGEYRLRIRHLAYGEREETIRVEEGVTLSLQIALTPTAIELEPLKVEVYSARELQRRASGVRIGEVSREQLDLAARSGMHLGDILQAYVPSVRVDEHPYLVGLPICIEFRGARFGPWDGFCRSPAVYLDGVPIGDPTVVYGTLNLNDIVRLEVVPPAEAGVRFGTGALWGALVIETRKPGIPSESEEDLRGLVRGREAFDWSQEPAPQNWKRVFAYAFVGNAMGLAAGVAVADRCIEVVAPTYDRVTTECAPWPTMGSAVAGVVLPALGGSLGARIGGRTERSQAEFMPAMVASVMALIPGYALHISSRRSEWRKTGFIGKALLVLGVPVATTIADRLFRTMRPGAEGGGSFPDPR